MNIRKQKGQKAKSVKQPSSYGQKEVDFSQILPMPEGFEKLFITIYLITIPYAVGLLFLFIFVAKGDFDSFISLDIAMFVAVWAIGYEIVAGFALVIIFYKMFKFNRTVQVQTRTRQHTHKDLHEVHRLS